MNITNKPVKYKIQFFNANGFLATAMFNSNHSVNWDGEYVEVSRKIANESRVVYRVKRDRISRIFQFEEMIFEQKLGLFGRTLDAGTGY